MKLKYIRSFVWILAALSTTSQIASALNFSIPTNKTLFVVGQDINAMNAYEKAMPGRADPAGHMIYLSLESGGLDSLTRNANVPGLETNNFRTLVNKGDNVIQMALHLHGLTAANIDKGGSHRAALETLLDTLKETKRPIFLRPGYEFEFAEYAAGGNGALSYSNSVDQAQFKALYNKIGEVVRDEYKLDNVALVWHAACSPIGIRHPAGYSGGNETVERLVDYYNSWLPNTRFIDYVAISYFDLPAFQSGVNMYEFTDNSAALARAAIVNIAASQSRPLIIVESSAKSYSSPTTQGAAFRAYADKLFEFVKANNVGMLSWINQNWLGFSFWQSKANIEGWGDVRVEAAPRGIQNYWKRQLNDSRFITGSDAVLKALNYNGN